MTQEETEGEGERERCERGREQRGEIAEIGAGRETERGEGQGREKEGRERKVVKGFTSTIGFHSLGTRVGSDQLKHPVWRDGQGGFEQPPHLPRCCASVGLVC